MKIQEFLTRIGMKDSSLAHYGIKGQKWGVRRSKGPGGTVSSSEDAKRAAASIKAIKKAGGTHALTDADLKHLVDRLNLEKKLRELDNTKLGKGNSAIKRVLGYGGTLNDAIRFANSDGGRALAQALGQAPKRKHVKL